MTMDAQPINITIPGYDPDKAPKVDFEERSRQLLKEAQRFLGNPVFRVIEKKIVEGQGEPLESLGICGKQVPHVDPRHFLPMFFEGSPGWELSGLCHGYGITDVIDQCYQPPPPQNSMTSRGIRTSCACQIQARHIAANCALGPCRATPRAARGMSYRYNTP